MSYVPSMSVAIYSTRTQAQYATPVSTTASMPICKLHYAVSEPTLHMHISNMGYASPALHTGMMVDGRGLMGAQHSACRFAASHSGLRVPGKQGGFLRTSSVLIQSFDVTSHAMNTQ